MNPPLLPETILQLGAGRFLRAFVDRFVQEANDAGQNVGRVVVVQSTAGRRAELLSNQPEGYQVLVRGYQEGQLIERIDKVRSISRALSAASQWPDVLALAVSPALRFIVSNATEAGYVSDPADRVDSAPPSSLAGKLTQILYRRFQQACGPVTLLPCELIERNATRLKELVLAQIKAWGLPAEFELWASKQCVWLNNLVDCIVTNGPPDHPLAARDPLLVCAEPYTLWAIEKPTRQEVQLFDHPAIRIVDDLDPYYLRKVRMLNGAHTAMVGKFLGQFETVQALLADRAALRWTRDLVYEEIVPTLAYRLRGVAEFADETFDRMRNPHLQHRLADIAMHHAEKVRVRLLPTKQEYESLFGRPPRHLVEAMQP